MIGKEYKCFLLFCWCLCWDPPNCLQLHFSLLIEFLIRKLAVKDFDWKVLNLVNFTPDYQVCRPPAQHSLAKPFCNSLFWKQHFWSSSFYAAAKSMSETLPMLLVLYVWHAFYEFVTKFIVYFRWLVNP